MTGKTKAEKKHYMPNGVLILFMIIVLVGALSYVIPAGKFEKIMVDGREVRVPTPTKG